MGPNSFVFIYFFTEKHPGWMSALLPTGLAATKRKSCICPWYQSRVTTLKASTSHHMKPAKLTDTHLGRSQLTALISVPDQLKLNLSSSSTAVSILNVLRELSVSTNMPPGAQVFVEP